MFKKGIMIFVALAIVATMVIAPVVSSAAGIADTLYFDVDFDTQDITDLAGNHTYEEDFNLPSTDLIYEEDEELGKYVLVLEGDGGLKWTNNNGETLNQYDLTEGLTMEMLLYITSDAETFKYNQCFFEANESALHFQEYNDLSDAKPDGDVCSGFRAGDSKDGGFILANAYVETTLPHGQWTHLLGVADATSNRFYVDGQLVAKLERSSNVLVSMYNKGEGDIYVGESGLGGMWGPTAVYGKIAFARIYKAAATDAEIGELYTAATGKEAPEINNDIESVATPAPIIEPTPDPDEVGS